MLQPIKTIDEIRSTVKSWKMEGHRVGFVPTMGALHEGHLSLIRTIREKADKIVVSIYVNPTQFGPGEDFEQYPRDLESDIEQCEQEGVTAVFSPPDEVMYPGENKLHIEIDELADHMCGAGRPGHFEGVLLIVNKLFNVVQPDVAAFGQKDIQQFVLIDHMVQEFNHDVELVMGDIKRANDGLALSSRNAYLSDEHRAIAPGLFRGLRYLKQQIQGGVKQTKLMVQHQQDELEAKGFEIDYLGVFAFENLKPVDKLEAGNKYILAGAVYLGETRLIDNLIVEL